MNPESAKEAAFVNDDDDEIVYKRRIDVKVGYRRAAKSMSTEIRPPVIQTHLGLFPSPVFLDVFPAHPECTSSCRWTPRRPQGCPARTSPRRRIRGRLHEAREEWFETGITTAVEKCSIFAVVSSEFRSSEV